MDFPVPSATKFDNGWNTSDRFLRPRSFCLTHAVEIVELLRHKGGAKVLVICHSGKSIILYLFNFVAHYILLLPHFLLLTLDEMERKIICWSISNLINRNLYFVATMFLITNHRLQLSKSFDIYFLIFCRLSENKGTCCCYCRGSWYPFQL